MRLEGGESFERRAVAVGVHQLSSRLRWPGGIDPASAYSLMVLRLENASGRNSLFGVAIRTAIYNFNAR